MPPEDTPGAPARASPCYSSPSGPGGGHDGLRAHRAAGADPQGSRRRSRGISRSTTGSRRTARPSIRASSSRPSPTAGWLGIMIPEEYGGAGLGVTEAALMLHEICASGAGTTGASPIHFYMLPAHAGGQVRHRGAQAAGPAADRDGRDRHGVRGDRAERGHRHLAHPDAGGEAGRSLGRQRPEGVDDQRPARQPHPPARAHERPRPRQAAQGHDAVLHRLRPQGDHRARDRQARPGRRGLQRDLHRQPGDARGGRGGHGRARASTTCSTPSTPSAS